MSGRRSSRRILLNAQAFWNRLDLLNMTQNELARLAGVTSGYISLLVSGKRCPSPDLRRRLMERLGVTDFHELFIMEELE